MTDPNHAHARPGDPTTSHQAAAYLNTVGLRDRQAAVLRVLAQGPCPDFELVERYAASGEMPQGPSGIRSRRSELVLLGRVEWTGQVVYRPGSQRRNTHQVWRVVRGGGTSTPPPTGGSGLPPLLQNMLKRHQERKGG